MTNKVPCPPLPRAGWGRSALCNLQSALSGSLADPTFSPYLNPVANRGPQMIADGADRRG